MSDACERPLRAARQKLKTDSSCNNPVRHHLMLQCSKMVERSYPVLAPFQQGYAMPTISETIAHLAALRKGAAPGAFQGHSRLRELSQFGDNPGALRAHLYLPPTLSKHPALVVVLHGCTQNAAGYDMGAGWSEMADRHGFALLFPEQQASNNPNLCFNWFSKEDSRRGAGEAQSIRNMIAAVVARHNIDAARIYVTGLSAGGAMTAVMLATYPEVFAGGAVVAGLPYGSAYGVPQALERMRGQNMPERSELEMLVRQATSHAGPWPTLSVWHGSGDATVADLNATALLRQWGALHDIGETPDLSESTGSHTRRVWLDHHGRPVMEDHRIAGMGHGTPLKTSGKGACGRAGAFMLEVGVSSSHQICSFWGLLDEHQEARAAEHSPDRARIPEPAEMNGLMVYEGRRLQPIPPSEPGQSGRTREAGVRKVIEDALRAAGLMP
nr:PHB depolymerase family esterase [uncultured Novosphingobium sp.]